MKAEDIEMLFHTFYLEKLRNEKNQENQVIEKEELLSVKDENSEKEKRILFYPELILH